MSTKNLATCNSGKVVRYGIVNPFNASLRIMNFKVQNIQWKNQKAVPGTAYNPTNIEHVANMLTHGIIIIPAIIATLHLIWRSKNPSQTLVAYVYGTAFILLFAVSTIFHCVFFYNKYRKLKDVLHRCDRAMIYVFIASSYFPWLSLSSSQHPTTLILLQWLIWLFAALGIVYQQIYHERFKCLETLLYICMGVGPSIVVVWCGHDFKGMTELKIGGIFYIIGVFFFKSDGSIPCAHAIWHLFVILAAFVHYFAILRHLYPTLVLNE